MKKNKMVSGLIGSFLLFATLAGCGSSNDSAGNESPSTDGEAQSSTVTVLVDNQTAMDGLEAVTEALEEKYNIRTEFEIRPGGSEGDNIVKTRLTTGEMADIMLYPSGSLFQALNPEEYFVELTGEEFIDRIDESYLETVSVDEKVYGVPVSSANAGGWFYNKKVYEEMGLSVPKTWDELMENNEKIKAAGKIPVLGTFKDTWTSQLVLLGDYYNVYSQLPTFADDYTHNKAKYADTPLALRGFEKLQELQDAGYMNGELSATSYEDGLRMLAEGEAAHYPMLTFALPAIKDTYPDKIDDIGFFGQPGDDPDNHGITLWMPGAAYLNKEAKDLDAGKKWIEFFISDEGMEAYMSGRKAEGPYMIKGLELPEDSYAAVQEMVPYLNDGKVGPALEYLSPIKGPSLEQITVEVGLGMTSAQEAAEKYDRDVEKQAKQLGIEGW
jgi:raffinose/stachyose/melibiose transport system substrate-binding protein